MKTLPIGTKVFDIRYGWGEVKKHLEESARFPIIVEFQSVKESFNFKGFSSELQKNPILSLTEYTLEKGGFTPISEYGKPKVGDWGYFWDNPEPPIYGKLIQIKEDGRFAHNVGFYCKRFSHEIPQEYIDYVNNLNK